MSEASDAPGVVPLLGDAGPAPTVAHGGRTWTIGHPTQRAKAELELLVVQAAEDALDELRAVLPPAKWQERRDKLDGHLFARNWKTFGPLWAELCNGPQSFPLLLAALMRAHHPDVALGDAQRLWADANRQCRLALMVVIPGFLDLLAGSLPADAADRKAQAAATAAQMLASLAPATPSS